MQSKFLKSLVLALTLLAASAGFQSAAAQSNSDAKEKPAVYTYVAQWEVNRADWPAFEKGGAAQKAILDKLMADGTITGYGFFKFVVHQAGMPNHGSWFSAPSIANLMKTLNAIVAAPNDAELSRIEAASKHFDLIMTSRQYAAVSGSYENGYLRVASYKGKAGMGEVLEKTISSFIVPLLEKLVADGTLRFYTIDHEVIHTGDQADFDIAIVANDASGLDKFNAALETAGKSNPLGAPSFGSATDTSAHRDLLALASGAEK